MHDAFRVSIAVENSQHKIKSVFAYGHKLFVGTSTGSLLVYEVKCPIEYDPQDESLSVTLLDTHRSISKRAIEQLDIIKESNLLVMLSDGHVSTYDLQTFKEEKPFKETIRGAIVFAIDTSHEESIQGIPKIVTRLAVGQSRKLHVFTWRDSEFVETKELAIPDKLRTMAWVTPNKLCLGLANEYALLDIVSSTLHEIFPTTSGQSGYSNYMGLPIGGKVKPLVTKLPNNEILLAKDNLSIFVGIDGHPTRKAGIDWSGAPEEIGYSYPYLIAILPKHIEVRNVATQTLVQTIELNQASLINAGKYLYIASQSNVWRFIPINYEKQIDQLVSQAEYEEAISLTEQIEPIQLNDKVGKLKHIHNLHAHHLFQQGKFEEAITIFMELETDPQEVVSLYPQFISGHLYTVDRGVPKNGIGPPGMLAKSLSESAKDKDLTSLPGTMQNSEKHSHHQHKENGVNKSEVQNMHSTSADLASEKSHLEKNDDKQMETNAKFEGKDLNETVKQLIRFLTDRRSKISKALLQYPSLNVAESTHHIQSSLQHEMSADKGQQELLGIAEFVDTSLLKAYMVHNDHFVGPLVRVRNHCNVQETEDLLMKRMKYKELVEFYHEKGLHRKSLELLHKLGEAPVGPMSGTFHTVQYLQKLGHDHLKIILEFATWVLKAGPEEGMEIFIGDHPKVETLPRDRVLSYLERFSPDLCIVYLKHIIHVLGDHTPDFHNNLIIAYLNKLKTLKDGAPDAAEAHETYQSLLQFLEESVNYVPEKILGRLPMDDFFEARAIVLSHHGQHDLALNIYVHKLKNEQMAENYCVKVYNEADEKAKDVFLSLVRIYLQPTPGEPVALEPALRLLSRHGTHINASQVLEMLPASIKIAELYQFMEKYIRESNRNRNMNMVVKNLLEAEKRQAQEQLMFYQSRRVKIDEDRMCPQCNRYIGHRSAFAIFPNGVVVHYHCKEKYSQAHDTV